jgi:hypothetical protein
VIHTVNNVNVQGRRIPDIVALIKGPAGSTVVLEVEDSTEALAGGAGGGKGVGVIKPPGPLGPRRSLEGSMYESASRDIYSSHGEQIRPPPRSLSRASSTSSSVAPHESNPAAGPGLGSGRPPQAPRAPNRINVRLTRKPRPGQVNCTHSSALAKMQAMFAIEFPPISNVHVAVAETVMRIQQNSHVTAPDLN